MAKEKALGDLKPGDTFLHNNHMYIKTDSLVQSLTDCYCVGFYSGSLIGLPLNLMVEKVL